MLGLTEETEQLARLVAMKSGRSPDAVIREVIEQHAVVRGLLPARKRRPIDMQKVAAIIERSAIPMF